MAGAVNSKVSVHSFDIKSHVIRTLDVPLDADGYIPRIKMTSDPTKVARKAWERVSPPTMLAPM